MPIARFQMPDGRIGRFEVPAGLTPQQAEQLISEQVYGAKAEPKTAAFSTKDLALSAGQGLAGGIKALTDLAGAGNTASKFLGDIQQAAGESMTPERQAEIARREEIKKAAEGNTVEEIKAILGGLSEAPLQAGIQALFSSAPIIAGSFLAPPAAAAATAGRVGLGARALAGAKNPATGIGALMGLGGQKGQDYEVVKQELLAKGYSEPEAERLAQKAAEYSAQNLPRQLASTAVGGLEGALGIERALGSLGRAAPKVDKAAKGLPEPTFGQALRRNTLEEALPEALQASTGQVGTNVALTQAGIPTDLLQGVAAQAINDALIGGGLGAVTSPAKLSSMRKEFVANEMAAKQEYEKEQREAIAAEQAKLDATKKQFGVGEELLALPAPASTITKEEEVPPLQNPIGNLTPDELGPEVTSYLNQYRKDNGLPRLKTYSIEDVKDAMTAVNPEGEKAALDSILAAKTGYTGEQNFTAKDVENAAIEKNIATGTKGFNDFLARTTGVDNLQEMSEPQIYAAFKALADMPANLTGQQIVLPEGTNASRFKQSQYNNAVKMVGLTFDERGGKPLSVDTILEEIKEATNLETDRDARAVLDTAIKSGDLTENKQTVYRTYKPENDQLVSTYPTRAAADAAAKKQGLNVREATLTQVAPKAAPVIPSKPRAGLPAGYDITERQFKEGEEPEGYQITSEAGGKPFPTVLDKVAVQGKIDQLSADRQEIAAEKLQEVMKYEDTVNQGKRELEKMEAAGDFDSDLYKQKRTRQAAKEDLLGKRIDALYKEIENLTAKLVSKPVGSKPVARTGFTITKEGKETGTFPTREAAEESILADLSDEALDALVSDKKFGGLANRAAAEQNRRRSAPPTKGKKVSEVLGTIEQEKPVPETPESKQKVADLRKTLDKFGLGDVALQIVKAIDNQADGSYAAKVIQLAVDAQNPIRTMRHEALHALKELGFFTPQQWKALQSMARKEWVNKYLKSKKATLEDGTVVTRYEAYQKLGLSEFDIQEEAIADAFGDFDSSKAPAGMLTALLNKMRNFFDALSNYLHGRGFQSYKDIFGQVEAGKLKPSKATPAQGKLSIKPADWKATPEVTAEAEDYFEENGIMPYTSEGQLDVPVEVSGTKFSIKGAYTEAQGQERVKKKRDGSEVVVPAKFNDPITGLPMNADGTVTLYYPTTNEIARNIATAKKLTAHSPTANRIYLTNESSANAVAETPGMIDQPLGGANVMFKVDPSMIEIAQTYENGRKDFFIPIAEGEVFEKKMKLTKLFTVNAPRSKGLHPDRSLAQVTEGIEKATEAWKNANAQERAKLFSDAKDVLRDEHNIGTLFGANAKLEKTNIGDYGLLFKGKKVMSTGLGFASAQKISDKRMESTCPKSAICEALCLGETSGQNELYGGEGPFRSGPRLSQYLKTEAFVVNPEAFATSLIRQIENFRNAAKKLGYYPAIRLNVTSDFPAKMFKPVIEMFPDVQFYDYTKLETKPIAENHHLTYSSTGASQEVNGNIIFNKESNWDRVVDKILSAGKNVAMAFTSRNDMPKFVKDERTGQTFEVWNGDEYDARFLDPVRNDGKGWIIGLTNKDRTTAPEDAASRHNGFFLDYNAEDGDTLVIKDQKRLAEEFQGKAPTGKVFPMKKLSLRTPAQEALIQDGQERQELLNNFSPSLMDKLQKVIKTNQDALDANAQAGRYEGKDKQRLKMLDGRAQSAYEKAFEAEFPDSDITAASMFSFANRDGRWSNYDALLTPKFSLREAPDTPEFKAWFGDSTIVNEDGTPKMMYHGTDKDVTSFARKTGRGAPIFLTDDPDFARRFAVDSVINSANNASQVLTPAQMAQGQKDAIAAIRKDYKSTLQAKEMIDSIKAGKPDAEAREYLRKAYKPMLPSGPNIMPVYVKAENPFDYENPEHVKMLLDKRYPLLPWEGTSIETKTKNGDWEVLELPDYQNAIKQLGFDSFYVKEDSRKNLAVYQPSQVKSAIGNIGTYDATNPDIRYSLREAPDTPEFKRWFSGSKFVNKDGTPKVLYHGTKSDVDTFKVGNGTFGRGIYVTEDPDRTKQYTGGYGKFGETMGPDGGNVMPIYVRMVNPKVIDTDIFKVRKPDGSKMNRDEAAEYITNQAIAEGHDGLVSMLGDKVWEAVVFNPYQIKSAIGNTGAYSRANPDIRYSLRDATENFDPAVVADASEQGYKSKEKLVSMPITDFLKLAEFGHSKRKQDDAEQRVKSDTKFTTIPYLEVYEKYEDGLRVTGHEGRHRARALLAEGKETMPVVLRGDIRWSEQNDPDKFDYVEQWPDRIYAQKGAINEYASIPMPVTREESVEDYQVKPLPTLKYSVRNIEDEVSKLPNGDALNAAIDRLATKREQKGFIERIFQAFTPDTVDALRQQWLNRYQRLSTYDKRLAEQMGGPALLADASAESAALMSDNANAIASQAIGMSGEGGIPVFKNGYTTIDTSVKGPLELLKPLAATGDPRIYQTYQFWAGAKRGSRLLASGRDHTYTPAEIAYAKSLCDVDAKGNVTGKFPEFAQVQADWIKYNDGLVAYQVATGVLSPERAAEYTRYSDYIPFYRQFEGQDTLGPKIFQSISGVKPPKKLKGIKEEQEAPLADFLETIVRNTQAAVQAGMKNTAAQRAIGIAVQLDEAVRLDKQTARPGTVTVLENGKPVSYEVADQLFVDAVKSLNIPELPFLSILSAPANALRNLVTKDPGFMMANLMRDSLSAWVTSGHKMTPVASTISNFASAIGGKDPAFLALKRAGVIGGYEFAQDVETSGDLIGKRLRRATGTQTGVEKGLRPFNSLWEGLEKGTEASDAATRMAVYKSVMERTGNEAEAIYRAMEVMNFNRKGNLAIVRILTAAVPFLNARMQGLDVFYRAGVSPTIRKLFFGESPTEQQKALQKTFFIRGATLTALTTMYWFLTHDDEEYIRQEQEVRDNNWLLPAVGIRVPTPFEVGVLFKVIPERILEYSFGNDTGKDLSESMGRALKSTFAFNPIPQTFLPLEEARTNYSFFTGRPIVGQGMEGVAPEYQVGPSTTKIAQSIGNSLGVSPMKVDHVIQGYTGTMGMYLVDLVDSILSSNDASPKADKRFEQMPIIKRFAVDKAAKGTVSAYYDLKNSVDEVVRTVNLLERTGKIEDIEAYMTKNAPMFAAQDYVKAIESEMKALREALVQVRSSDMTGAEKKDAISELTEAQNQLTSQIKLFKKEISKSQ
jgi:hypothetical protein